jgi:hypothetical protein
MSASPIVKGRIDFFLSHELLFFSTRGSNGFGMPAAQPYCAWVFYYGSFEIQLLTVDPILPLATTTVLFGFIVN